MSIARDASLAASLAAWLLVTAALPSDVNAQPAAASGPTKAERAAARDAYDKGTVAFDKGDFVTALDHFVKANALIPSIQAMYWIARSQDQLGRTTAAIEAYEALTSRADFSSLSADKASTVRERLAAEPPAASQPEPAPPVEPAPAPIVIAPVSSEHSPPAESPSDVLPQKNTAELGVMGGVLFVSPSHNLVEGGSTQREFHIAAGQIGARAAFFPEKVFGIEAEWAHGIGKEKEPGDSVANFDVFRGHLIGQLPSSRFVPFALVGAGLLRGSSDTNGEDADFLLQAGVGFKVMATELLVPRLDARLGMTQKEGGGFADGIAFHPELLLGLGFTLGR